MCAAESKWTFLEQHETLDLSNKFEVQIAIVKPPDGPPHISIRKYAKYIKSTEKKQGLSDNEAIFRPMKEGVLFPACRYNDLLNKIECVINGEDQLTPNVRLFSTERVSELRINLTSSKDNDSLINIEKWAQISNSDRKKTGIERLYPTTKISIPTRCWKKYLNTVKPLK